MLQDWKIVRIAAVKPNSPQQTVARSSWCKPMAGKVKCNIDASFPSGSNRVGIGICIRDDQ
ncbi:cytochrome P450, partial [Trifolium medium]|nr:cytochrome P450 [Trifolium medium]